MTKDEQSETRPLAGDVDGFSDDSESLISKPALPYREPSEGSPRRILWTLGALLFFICSVLSGGAVGFAVGRRKPDLDAECAAYTTQYSPVLSKVGIKYDWKRFNGTFLQEVIYRKPGSPEVDAAWEDLGVDSRAGIISYEEGLKSGLTEANVQRSDHHGGGFFVNVEGMHHLHCLNLVRKSLYFNYDYYKALGTHAFVNDDDIVQLHVSHCLDIIRQTLMCNIDTGVLGQVWVDKSAPNAFPDFNTQHKCKNFDDIKTWAVAHQADPPETLPPDYMKQPNLADVLDATP